jgi:D-alanyl-D-alanine carboxypeptidase
MMIFSGNDASRAIAEHVWGDEATFVDFMNAKAKEIGMPFTLYGGSWGGCYSVPADQARLFAYAWDNYPYIREVMGRVDTYTAITTHPDLGIQFYDIQWPDPAYVGMDGWKGGSKGQWFQEFADGGYNYCTSGGCRVSQNTRLGRTLLVGIQQSGNPSGETRELLDYGYDQLFTPDLTGDSAAQGGAVNDFAIDAVMDTLSMTAVIRSDGSLDICTWQVVAWIGQIEEDECFLMQVDTLPAGPSQPRSTLPEVDLVLISTLLTEGDYIRARKVSGVLVLDTWQVGSKEP